MRVVVNEGMKVFHGHRSLLLTAGQEVGGSLAVMLAERAPGKVTRVGEEPAQVGDPESLEDAATAAGVLAWVGEDPERAVEALAVEEASDKPRSTLVKSLKKLIDQG